MGDPFFLLPRIINSAVGGSIAAFCTYPFELIKTRFQTQTASPGGVFLYKSIPDAFLKIRKHEGVTGLYRGLLLHLSYVTPEMIINLCGNDFFRKMLHPDNNDTLSIARQTFAGALTGLTVTLIATPMEFIKIQLQDEGRMILESKLLVKPKLNARKVIWNIITRYGITGAYKGLSSCIFRDVPFGIVYFPMFAFFFNHDPEYRDGSVDFMWTLLSGTVAGSMAAFLVTPMDVVKTRIQTQHASSELVHCNKFVHCIQDIYRTGGFQALFRGAGCRVLSTAPLLGITEMVYYFGVAEYLLNEPMQKFVR